MPGWHPGFVGKKGRSGRPSWDKERTIQNILKLSAQSILHYLHSDKYPLENKAKLSAELFKRQISDKKEIDAHVLTQEEQTLVEKYARPGLN